MVHADPDDLGRGDNSEPGPPPVNGKASKAGSQVWWIRRVENDHLGHRDIPTMIDSQSVLSLQFQEDLILVTFACQVTGNAGARIACGEIKLQTKASSGE